MDDLISRKAAIEAICHEGCGMRGMCVEILSDLPSVQQWIPVEERMPEEHDSIFARFYGTDKWRNGMFLKDSDYVLVTVEFKDGKRITQTSSTVNGEWHFNGAPISRDGLHRKVIAWKPFPEPYKE